MREPHTGPTDAMFTGAEPSTPVTPLKATPTPNQYVYLDFARSVDSSWFNPALGTSDWGPYPHNMIDRNFFRAPGSFNLNLGINKNFTFGESRRLQFRGELFNFFNHPNLEANIADNDVSSSRASRLTNRAQLGVGLRRLNFRFGDNAGVILRIHIASWPATHTPAWRRSDRQPSGAMF